MNTSKDKEEYFDTVVIGGGAAGMMAAIAASGNGTRVAIIEKNDSLGKKLLLTGNGRCNLTQNISEPKEFISRLDKKGKFLFSSLSAFGPKETMEFFEKIGLPLKTEKNGRVFPKSDKAADVLKVLERALKRGNIKIFFSQPVKNIKIKDKKIECVELKNKIIYAKNFIISTGGKSFPTTGSTGDGYDWLAGLGHQIVPPTPALVPVKIAESWIKNLQGISLKNTELKLTENNKKIKIGSGGIIFTHFGLSGPAIINASKIIGQHLAGGKVFLEIDLLPDLKLANLEEKLKIDFEKNKKKSIKNYLVEFFPDKLTLVLLELNSIEKDRKINSVIKEERKRIAKIIKNFPITAIGLLDFNQAMITSGGVSLREIDQKTMRSKIISNLFLAGEILDLDGPTGGYNLQIAWTTGFTSGNAAKNDSIDKHG